jgi:hypothetical protein
MIGVGKCVGVTVGGNQIIVGVTVAVGNVGVSVGSAVVAGAAVQPAMSTMNRQKGRRFFIPKFKPIRKTASRF